MTTTSDAIWKRLTKSKRYREEFVAAQAKRAIPFQISALMEREGLTQKELGERAGLTQGAVSRAADSSYGNLTLNTIIRIAAGFDVAFLGRFVPFSELVDFLGNLSEERLGNVPSFRKEAAKRKSQALRTAPPSSLDGVPMKMVKIERVGVQSSGTGLNVRLRSVQGSDDPGPRDSTTASESIRILAQ